MKKYTAVSIVIKIARVVAWFLYILGFVLIIILFGFDEDFGKFLAPVGLFFLVFGFIIQILAELLAIFRDVAINTQKTNELLENNGDKTVAKSVKKKTNAFQEKTLDDFLDDGNKK